MPALSLLTTFIQFLTIAVLVAYGASRIRVPYTVAMVLAGLGVSLLRIGLGREALRLEPQLILLIFLPGLLFEASYHIDFSVLRANMVPILLLAIPGVLISTVVVGFLLRLSLGLPLPQALLFGTIISATDPVAVVALFRELGVDRRLGIIVEGESLFNDGVAIVSFGILAGVATGSSTFQATSAVAQFFVTVAGGAALGLVAGFLVAELMKRIGDPLIDIALTAILAYGVYLLADDILNGQVSPVIGVVVAGIVLGNYGTRGDYSATSSVMIGTIWEFVAFTINSAIFLLIGLEVEISILVQNIAAIALTIGAVLAARAVVVYGFFPLVRRTSAHFPFRWSHVMLWGGMRGAVSIALGLSLAGSIQSRQLMIALVFGFVLFSIVVQGLTIRPLLNLLNLIRSSEKQAEFERAVSRMAMSQASLSAIERMRRQHLLSNIMAGRLRDRFRQQIEEHSMEVARLTAREPDLADTSLHIMQEEVGSAQKQTLRYLLQRGIISEEVYAEFIRHIDERMQKAHGVERGLSARIIEELQDMIPQEEQQEQE